MVKNVAGMVLFRLDIAPGGYKIVAYRGDDRFISVNTFVSIRECYAAFHSINDLGWTPFP